MFGSPHVTIPFLLDMLRLPADMFQLYLASGILVDRMGNFLGAIHLLFVTVLTTAALSGKLIFQWRKLIFSFVFIIVFIAVATICTKAYLSGTLSEEYNKDQTVRNMHSAIHSSQAVIHRSLPSDFPALEVSAMQRISENGVIRIGYNPDNLPMSFFNASDKLVGYDIDMAHLLAQQMACQLEFVPFELSTLVEQLNRGDFDIAMSGIVMPPPRLTQITFSEPYGQTTAAIVIQDHRRDEFIRRLSEGDFQGIRLALTNSKDAGRIVANLLPGAVFVEVSSLREYCESRYKEVDGMIWSAESGSAWTLLYPNFSVVPIRPLYRVPIGYAVSYNNTRLADFVSQWIKVVQASPTDELLYEHWILGKSTEVHLPRWSVIRNVLHWVK